jgi:uncharacterized protein DUF5329
MRLFKLALTWALFLALVLPAFLQAQTTPLSEKEKIEALINLVSQLKTAKFVRNGWTYSADTAATFLRLKWQANDAIVKTARDFIDRIGSMSGTSGKPYLVRLKDGTEVHSREFLLGELKKLETPIVQSSTGG